MSGKHRFSEVPLQDYARIQLMFLPSALSNGKLFTDFSFPPDKSSLTYVYSGDDRYEKMVFKRPKEIDPNSVFVGVGGVYECPFPWKQWRKYAWFETAIAVLSLNFRQMDKLIPGYRSFDQSFQTDYFGCFCFKLWRFGEWIDIIVDDHLPTLNNSLLYCPSSGTPTEFWGPLVEKAYAKCKKTYEANECGRTLDALTDLTGGICEFFVPDINPPENLFHILYKSCVNRSQIVCWRNDKILTPAGFLFPLECSQEMNEDVSNGRSKRRYLHIITAATKFPMSDGRMVEMLRVMSPYQNEPHWQGKFSNRDEASWSSVNADFLTKYKPQTNKEANEYWITFEDFRCNFGGMFIISSEIPFTTEGLNLERCFRRPTEQEIKSGQKVLYTTKDRRRSSDSKRSSRHTIITDTSSTHYVQHNMQTSKHRPKRYTASNNRQARSRSEPREEKEQGEAGILVRENVLTVKVDNTTKRSEGARLSNQSTPERIREFSSIQPQQVTGSGNSCGTGNGSPVTSCLQRLQTYVDKCKAEFDTSPQNQERIKTLNKAQTSASSSLRKYSETREKSHENENLNYYGNRSGSLISNCSAVSDCPSTFSASDITLNMPGDSSVESTVRRKSAPSTCSVPRNSSLSLSSMTVQNFAAMTLDYFRSHGSWRSILSYTGEWERSEIGISSTNLKFHSRNPRILLNVLHADAANQIIASGYHGRSHMIISLLQDYRHGAPTANSLLVPIGFSVYRTKNPGKDEKRSLSKLHLVGEISQTTDSREVSGRFDLWPGSYFVVPYNMSDNHAGQFLVRILAEKDPVAGKTGWCVLRLAGQPTTAVQDIQSVVASQNNTVVQIVNTTSSRSVTLNRLENFREFLDTGESIAISADKPVLVVQFSVNIGVDNTMEGDVSMVQGQYLDNFLNRYVFFVSDTFYVTHRVRIVIEALFQDDLCVNGSPLVAGQITGPNALPQLAGYQAYVVIYYRVTELTYYALDTISGACFGADLYGVRRPLQYTQAIGHAFFPYSA